MKKITGLLSTILIIAMASISVYADVYVDGAQLDKSGYVDGNGSTMVQLRPLAEKLGCTVDWIAETNTVCISQDIEVLTSESGGKDKKEFKKYVEVQVGNRNMYINYGESVVEMPSPVSQIGGVTYVPLRSICEEFGCSVEWNSNSQAIDVKTPNEIYGCKVYKDFVIKNSSVVDARYDEDTMYLSLSIRKNSDPSISVEELRQILKARMTESESCELANYINDYLWLDTNTRFFNCKFGNDVLYIKSDSAKINVNIKLV